MVHGPGVSIHALSELARLVRRRPDKPARVVIAIPDEAHASVYDQLTALAQGGVEVLSMASVYEQVTGRVPVRHLGNFWWAMLPRPPTDIVYLGAKRAIDLTLGIAGLLLLAVLLPCVALLQQLDSPGPLFFTQVRVGRYGRSFKLAKI